MLNLRESISILIYFFNKCKILSQTKSSTLRYKLLLMNWIILIIAGLFEVGFASCLGKVKETSGNEMYWWFGGFLACLTISMVLLIKATETLPIGTAYAVWTGIGAVGTVLM